MPQHVPHALAVILALSPMASAEVLFDQIGGNDGSALAGDTYSSIHFLPENPLTDDLAAVDAFDLGQRSTVDGVEFVLDGWAAFDGPEDIVNYQVNVYSDLEAAASNLVGDILSFDSEPVLMEDWTGDGWLIRLPVLFTLDPGNYLLSVLMSNPYPDNGWVGVATTTIGDNQAWQVAPDSNYVFSPYIEAPDNLAYRLTGTPVPAPTSLVVFGLGAWPRRRRTR